MSNHEQPEALRLASRIGGWHAPSHPSIQDCDAAAAELRRQHEVITELVEALRVAVRQNEHDMVMTGEELRYCSAALERAKEQR